MKKLLLAVVACLAVYGLAIAAVNINTATKEELLSLKGVGEKRAEEVINYRTKNGPFKAVDDLGKSARDWPGAHEADSERHHGIRQAGDRQTRRGFNKNSAESRRFPEVREGYERQALDGEIKPEKNSSIKDSPGQPASGFRTVSGGNGQIGRSQHAKSHHALTISPTALPPGAWLCGP